MRALHLMFRQGMLTTKAEHPLELVRYGIPVSELSEEGLKLR